MSSATPSVTLVGTPTEEWLRESLSACRECFLAASPYIGEAFRQLVSGLDQRVERVLVTRADVRAFALGASNPITLQRLAERGFSIRTLSRLHAKVYVIDGRRALITSANATLGGLRLNAEFGVAIYDPPTVAEISRQVLSGFGRGEPSLVGTTELAALARISARVKPSLPTGATRLEESAPVEDAVQLVVPNTEELLADLSGWRRLVMEVVIGSLEEEFTLEQVYAACETSVRERYPDNPTWKATLRRVLQELRDLGFIEFQGEGQYRKTFRQEGAGST